jgi:hypothetical protein
VYHKLYNQLYAHAVLSRGQRFEAAVVIRGTPADAANWKAAAKALADEIQRRFSADSSGF